MRRRNVIASLAAIAAAPTLAHAQRPERMRRVGLLHAFAETDPIAQPMVQAFEQTLQHSGWVEGNNIQFDRRFAAGDPALFKLYAAELVGLDPDVIFAATPSAVAALQQQTRTIPIVFTLVVDPVGLGFVHSLARPEGNITGFSVYDAEIAGKWVELLHEIAPHVTRIAVIFCPETAPYAALYNRAIEAAAQPLGITASAAPVRSDAEIANTVAAHAREAGGALIMMPDIFNATHRDATIAAALRHGLPLMGFGRLFAEAGTLMSYFTDPAYLYGQAATYIDRILRGARPAELPVQQPTKFELIINLKTAKALGLTVPQSLLQRADEIIE